MIWTEQFPVLANSTYLNTANSGILSESLLDWRRNHDHDFYNSGSAFRLGQAEFLEGVKTTLAGFFHAKVQHTFLVPNFSFGFNTFLEGLTRNHRFLLLQEDYPSLNYPVRSRGFSYEEVPIDEYLEEKILERIRLFKPTVWAFSMVQYLDGIKLDPEFVKKVKGMYPDLIIVADGTQFCGIEDFNFEQSGLDVLIASGYKWLLGGYGNGFVLLKDDVAGQLYLQAGKSPHPTEAFLQDKSILSLCFEPGHQDTLTYGSLQQSVSLLNQLGFDYIETRITEVSEKAKACFAERGLLSRTVLQRKTHSSIFKLDVPDHLLETLEGSRSI